jgi:hypothetical protein
VKLTALDSSKMTQSKIRNSLNRLDKTAGIDSKMMSHEDAYFLKGIKKMMKRH